MVKKFFKVFFFTASLTFAACSNITSAPDEQRESTTQTTCATLSGRLIVNGALPSASSGTQSARTAFPTVPETFNYRVTAQKGSETVTGTVDTSDPDDITYSVSFPSSGNWTVTAEALSSSTVFLSASATVDAANDSGKNFLLRYPSTSTSGTGTVNLKISYANTIPVNSIAAKMVGFDTATFSVHNSSFTTSPGYKTFTYTRSSVPLGPHKLTVYFKDSSDQTIYYLEQIVNVYKDHETNKFYGDELYIDSSSGEIKLEASHLSSTQLTTFYVHGTNGTATGTGSIFSPVKTLGQAANLVNNSTATPAAGSFKIILQTNTTETSSISLTKDVEIISDADAGSSTALHTVTAASGENVTITSSADLVSLENIAFASLKGFVVQSGSSVIMNTGSFSSCSATDGGAVYVASGAEFLGDTVTFSACSATNYGGAIYSEGDVSLETCSITGCSAGHGGAIFAKNCELGLNNCTISGNSSTSEAGAIQLSGSDTTPASLIMYECIIGTETPSALASATKDECLAAGGNYSSGGGGGILLGNYSTLTSTDSKINGNYAGGAGGGINAGGTSSNTNVTVKITGGEICYNRANNNAGGLQIYSLKTCGSFVKNTKIQNNHANGSGGALSVTSGHYLKMENCTEVSGNSAGSVKGCYVAGSLTLAGYTYIADGIYLNTNTKPLLLENSFALSGTNKIPLSYRTTESTQFTTGNILLNGANSNSITAEQCAAFELADDTFKITHNTSVSPYTGILAEASAGTLLEVGSGKTFATLKEALEHIDTNLPEATSEEDGYEIKICGNLELTEDLEISVPYVKITSDDDATHRSISGGDTPTYGVKVTAAGVQFDKVDFTALLGGINVASGDLTLNNSKVGNGKEKYTSSTNTLAAGITVAEGAKLKSTEGLIIDGCDTHTTSENKTFSGIYSNKGIIELTSTIIKNCDNEAGYGGAVYCYGGKTTLTDCDIYGNNAKQQNGGAIYCTNGAEVELKGTTKIHDNAAWTGKNGGGIYVSNGTSEAPTKFTMENTVRIYENRAGGEGGGSGGGIYVYSGKVKLILNSSASPDKDNGNTATSGGALCYIADDVTILAGSTINGTSWSADTVLSSSHIAN